MTRSKRSWAVRCYLSIEALALVVFWVMYHTNPAWRSWIVPAGKDGEFGAFLLPDLAFLLPLAIGGAIATHTRSRWLWTWAVMHCGGAVYATLWTVAAAWHDPAFTTSAMLMIPMMLTSIVVVLLLRSEVAP